MTKVVKVWIREEEGRVRAEGRCLLDYDAARPPKGGPTEAGGLTASSLPLWECARTNITLIFIGFLSFWNDK